jgi:GDPmannose 4,6-dehydratase
MIAVIFGANSQDGYYLGLLCRHRGANVVTISRSDSQIQGDIADYAFVERLVTTHKPAYIFHLAANSTTHHEALFENHATISAGTLNVLEAVKRHSPSTKVFITGSAVQFKNSGNPITESDEFEASSAYAVARIQSVYAARYYRSLGIRAYVGYLFHHESPLRKKHHVSQWIASAVRRIADGSDEILEIGDMSVEKEWNFAGDIATGMLVLLEQDECFEAVIGSGVAYTIQDWVEQCFAVVGIDWHDYVRQREGYAPEYKRLVSYPDTMRHLGWRPTVNFEQLARMMVGKS